MLLWKSDSSRTTLFRFSDSILYTLRRRVSKSASAVIACYHDHAHTQSFPPLLNHSEVWFVKVVCTLCIHFPSSLDILGSDYFCENLTPSIAFNVIRFITSDTHNPILAFNFFEFTRTNLKLIHSSETYNLLLRPLCQLGLHDSVKLVCECMRIDGYAPDSYNLEFLVSSFAQADKFDVAKWLLAQSHSCENAEIGSYVYNNLLSLLVKRNRVHEAVSFFQEFILSSKCPRVDTCTFNIVIRGLCRVGEVYKAFRIFNDMGSFSCWPDLVTYNTLINGLCRSGEVDKGRGLLREVQSRNEFPPNVVTYTSVITGYCKVGNMEVASNIFDEMISSGTKPNSVTFNVLIDGFGKKGDMVSALNMYEKMLLFGCLPDVVTFTSLIDGYCRSGLVDQGMKLWDEMKARNLSPNVYTFAIVINSLCKENRLNEACEFLRLLNQSVDIVPQPFIYNLVIDGLCKAGNVDEANLIVEEMVEKRCNPDRLTFTILIIGHCMKGKMLEAISIFGKMLEIGCAPDTITVNSLITCLLKAGMPYEAARIMQTVSEGSNLGVSSKKRTIPLKSNMDITIAV